ncbi:MAG: hypothetical protein IIW14_05660 [Kiritimatiellae bacterium]|nr:hypothetical protein [Kiritimatiellia bacterium]
MKNVKICIVGITVFCALSHAANAALVKLTKDSDKGFDEAYGWDSAEAPKEGNDYLVSGGYYLRGDYNEGFAGDSLQFGIVGGTEGVFFKEHAGTHTFKKLILANGYYRTWMSNNGQAAHIAGNVEVQSPESVPFRLHSTHNSGLGWYLTYWDAKFSGAEGTGLKVGPFNKAHLSKGENIFTGDNSAYSGSFYFYGTNAVAAFTAGTSLGGAILSFKSDAIVLADGTTLEFRGTSAVLEKNLNRGITVSSTGGRISVPAGKTLEVEWPIVCEGPLVKTGTGTLVLDSAIGVSDTNDGAASFTVSEGDVRFSESFVADDNLQIAVLSNAAVSVDAGREQMVGGIRFEGGAIRVSYDEATGKSGVLVLCGTGAVNKPIPVYPPSVRGIKVPFLKMPLSAGVLTGDLFVKPADHAAKNLPSATITVETQDDYQIAYARTCNLVTVTDKHPDTEEANNKAYLYPYGSDRWRWSDNDVVRAGVEYLVGKSKTVYSTGMTGDWVFPGESVTFRGEGGSRANWELGNESLRRFTGDVRTFNYSRIYPDSTNGGELHICGRLHVGSKEGSDNGLDFRAKKNMTTVIDSVVSGSGYMCFQAYADNLTNTYYFTADNTFDGTYFVYSARANTHTVLKFARSECFGPNPPSPRAKNLLLQGEGSELYIEGSQKLDHSNREIAFHGSGSMLRVEESELFDMTCKLAFSRGITARKVGGGTWAVGGEVRQEGSGDAATLAVDEGFIRADKPKALVNIKVKIAEGAGIAARYRPGETGDAANYGMMVTNSTRFAVSGETLRFKVFTEGKRVRAGERIALISVPQELESVIDAKKIVFEHDDIAGRNAVLVKNRVTISSASYICYSCRLVSGLTLILR